MLYGLQHAKPIAIEVANITGRRVTPTPIWYFLIRPAFYIPLPVVNRRLCWWPDFRFVCCRCHTYRGLHPGPFMQRVGNRYKHFGPFGHTFAGFGWQRGWVSLISSVTHGIHVVYFIHKNREQLVLGMCCGILPSEAFHNPRFIGCEVFASEIKDVYRHKRALLFGP